MNFVNLVATRLVLATADKVITSIMDSMLLRAQSTVVQILLVIAAAACLVLGLWTNRTNPTLSAVIPPAPVTTSSAPPSALSVPQVDAPPELIVPEGSRVIPLGNFPDDPRLDVVGIMLKSGQFAQAELACRTVLKERPEIGRAEFLLGLAITKQKRYEEAKVHFLAGLLTEQTFIERPHTPHFLGWCHFHLGEMDEARVRFEEHLVAVPNEPDSTFGLAVVNIAQDRNEEAARLLDAAFIAFGDAKPRDQARVLVRQSDLALRSDDPVKAEEILERAATLAPTFPEIWAKTARVKDRLGKSEQASIARENEKSLRERLDAASGGGAS